MQSQSPLDLTQFKRWYSQERTPTLKISSLHDEKMKQLTITVVQSIPKDTQGREQLSYAMPLSIGLLDSLGQDIQLKSFNATMIHEGIVWIDQAVTSITFDEVYESPTLSLNRHFSAPVKIEYENSDYPFLMAHDSDGFVRYEASQVFGIETIEKMMKGEPIDPRFVEAYGAVLRDDSLETLFKAELLGLPTITTLMQRQEILDIESLHASLEMVKKHLASHYKDELLGLVERLYEPKNGEIDALSMARRALKNRCLGLLMTLKEESISQMCRTHYTESVNMTSRLAALDLLENYAPDLAQEPLNDFYQKHNHETLIMNKYFALLASSRRDGTLERVVALQNDGVYDSKVPNLVRALIGSFTRNMVAFHHIDGTGYAFVADKVIEIDAFNPQIASGLAGAFKSYGKLAPLQKAKMGIELERIKSHPNLSNNVYEIVGKILEAA
jgi:aminopeptidase N